MMEISTGTYSQWTQQYAIAQENAALSDSERYLEDGSEVVVCDDDANACLAECKAQCTQIANCTGFELSQDGCRAFGAPTNDGGDEFVASSSSAIYVKYEDEGWSVCSHSCGYGVKSRSRSAILNCVRSVVSALGVQSGIAPRERTTIRP